MESLVEGFGENSFWAEENKLGSLLRPYAFPHSSRKIVMT